MFTVTKEQIIEAFRATHTKPESGIYLAELSDGENCGCALGALYLHRGGEYSKAVSEKDQTINLEHMLRHLGMDYTDESTVSAGFSDGRRLARGVEPWRTPDKYENSALYTAVRDAARELYADYYSNRVPKGWDKV